MTTQNLIDKLQDELNYTQLESNIEKLYSFLTSEKVNDIDDYQKILLETQFNAMNIYRNSLILRLSNFNTIKQQEENESTSN